MRIQIEQALETVQTLAASGQPGEESALLFDHLEAVHQVYIATVNQALSFLVQNEQQKCNAYLQSTRDDLEDVKQVIGDIVSNSEGWNDEFMKMVIEYLFTRARLVDEVRSFPSFALDLLERTTLDQTLEETIAWLEMAMTGKSHLYEKILEHRS